MPHEPSRRFWETRASALAWRINLAAWLARAAPATFFLASAFAVAFYAVRRAQFPLAPVGWALAVVFVLAGAGCWWRARRFFFNAAEARVLIESHLRLDTRLTAASLGLTPWPPPPATAVPVVRWRLGLPAGWVGGALALLVLSLFAPVPRDSAAAHPSSSPPALLQAEDMLNALKEMKVADPQAIEQLADRASELARRPAEEQYSHSALEAADALRNQIAVSAAGLGRGLDSAANAMRAADGRDLKGAAAQLAAALAGMRGGAMPANRDLLAGLPGSEADLKGLSAAQRAALAQQLAEAGAGLEGIAGAAGAGARIARAGANHGYGSGNGFGHGGEGGGGGHPPLGLAQDPSKAGDGNAEALSGDALKRLALGDKLGTSAGAQEIDPNAAAGPEAAGAIAAPASGGEAVWVNRLTPTERAALKDFFK